VTSLANSISCVRTIILKMGEKKDINEVEIIDFNTELSEERNDFN